ncbi:MAG: hypothetical protein IJL98_00645 [Lachnospiraceae bacterium]|nr:hypothetical protein [Lachnospiraceae bacterium]
MNAFFAEILMNLKSRWFWFTVFMTVLVLFLSHDRSSMNLTLLSLPLLSALPAASFFHKELASKSFRPVLFRCGLNNFLFSRVAGLLFITLMSMGCGMGLFLLLFRIFVMPFPVFTIKELLARLISSLFFALTGSTAAVLLSDSIFAYVFPVALCFSLSMLHNRFFYETDWIDPAWWLSGESQALIFLLFIVTAGCILYSLCIRKAVNTRA